jgi:hypothetical protein
MIEAIRTPSPSRERIPKLTRRALLYWLLMAVVIVANGFVGALAVSSRFGEYPNHVYKSVVAILIVLLASHRMARTLESRAAAWFVGLLWCGLTVMFEFVIGHYVFGNSWPRLVADYRLWEGRLWSLVLLAEVAGPPLMFALLPQGALRGWRRRMEQWKKYVF